MTTTRIRLKPSSRRACYRESLYRRLSVRLCPVGWRLLQRKDAVGLAGTGKPREVTIGVVRSGLLRPHGAR